MRRTALVRRWCFVLVLSVVSSLLPPIPPRAYASPVVPMPRLQTPACAPISLLACAAVAVDLPFSLTWGASSGGLADANGVGTGFTLVVPPSDPITTPPYSDAPGYEPSLLDVDTQAGMLDITTTRGELYTDSNAQVNALGVGVTLTTTTQIATTIVAPDLVGSNGDNYQQAGIWFGLDEDNYVTLVVMKDRGDSAVIDLVYEVDGDVVDERDSEPIATISSQTMTLTLTLDPATGRVVGSYQLDGGDVQPVGTGASPITLPASWFSGVDHDGSSTTSPLSSMGISATHTSAAADPITFAFDQFRVAPVESLPIFHPSSLLDDFNRADGALGSLWEGGTIGFEIVDAQLQKKNNVDPSIYWPTVFEADQEASVILNDIDRSGSAISLLLKGLSAYSTCGALGVSYDPSADVVTVWTCDWLEGWQQQGSAITAHFADGDRFGARAYADGTVEALKNGVVIAQVPITSDWAYVANGGLVGLTTEGGYKQLFDDFVGGSIAPTGTTPTPTATNTPTATTTPTTTDTPTGTVTDTPTATRTPIDTAVATDTPTGTVTDTPTATRTPIDTAVATDTPTATATETATATPTATPADTAPPSAPTGLGATQITTSSMALAWDAATDNVGVVGYEVYQGTTLIGRPATTVFTATQLTASTVYSFTVRAYDLAGNVSAPSGQLILRTKDDTPPSVPTNLHVRSATSTAVTLEWDPASDNVEVVGYDLYASGTQIAQTQDAFFTVENLQVLASYAFSVAARDHDGNTSAPGAVLDVTIPDTDPPSAPATLDVASVTDTSATFSWAAATDNVAVTSYTLYSGATAVLTTTAQTATITGLAPNALFSATVRARDAAGNESEASPAAFAVTTDTTAPTVPTNLHLVRMTDRVAEVAWDAASDAAGVASYEVRVGGVLLRTTELTQTVVSTLSPASPYSVQVRALDPSGNASTDSSALLVTTPADDGLPDDPRDVAPPLDRTIIQSLAERNSFLYSGANPIQTGVLSGTIDPQQVAVLHGQVIERDGQPLPSVAIQVLDHPEFGATLSRADGAFDLVVNGGGTLTLTYSRSGYLPAQRQVIAGWQEDAFAPTVALVPVSSTVTPITLGSGSTQQMASGDAETDADGTRQALVIFPANTSADLVFTDGSTTPLTETFELRITEYTVGENGPLAMPGALPPNSGYTYAADFQIDEAITAGAQSVTFDQPVSVYVENFIGFPVGETVPAGYYDAQAAAWVPGSYDGTVIKIMTITNGLAEIDANGDGIADQNDAYVLYPSPSPEELEALASRYSVGQELWRVPIEHFTPWDFNWPYGPPADAVEPAGQARFGAALDQRCTADARSIPCENQTLHAAFPVADAPAALAYGSDRAWGRRAAYQIQVPVTGATVPANLQSATLTVSIAGSRYKVTRIGPSANITETVIWPGLDGYGRPIQGEQIARVRVEYAYDGVRYSSASGLWQAFGQFSQQGGIIRGERGSARYTMAREWVGRVGVYDAQAQGLGGLTLTTHHVYAPALQTLYYGDGTRRQIAGNVIRTLAGTGTAGDTGDDGLATAAELNMPNDVAVDARGNSYIADTANHRIRRVSPSGVITTVAGDGTQATDFNDGSNQPLSLPSKIAVAPNGDLYVAEFTGSTSSGMYVNYILSRIHFTSNGYTVVRLGSLGQVGGIAVAPNGTVYVADVENTWLWQALPGHDLIQIQLSGLPHTSFLPQGLDVDADGNLYIADAGNDQVLKLSPSGSVETLVGAGSGMTLVSPTDVLVKPDNTLLISSDRYVWQRSLDGVLTVVAGASADGLLTEGGAAVETTLDSPSGLALSPDGSLVIADPVLNRVWRVRSVVPTSIGGQYLIPSEDGSVVDAFDAQGRHVATRDATTGATLLSFTYDSRTKALATIRDATSRKTTIARQGSQVAVTAPSGATTRVTLNTRTNDATLITSEADARTALGFGSTGLLTTVSESLGGTAHYTYTPGTGRLASMQSPSGATTTLARIESTNAYTVTVTDPLNNAVDYSLAVGADGTITRTQKRLSTTRQSVTTLTTSTISEVDGTVTAMHDVPDPRWGMLAPLALTTTRRTAGGVIFASTDITRTVTGLSLSDPFSFTTLHTAIAANTFFAGNHQTTTINYTPASRTYTITDPSGVVTTRVEDARGRVTQEQSGKLPTVSYSYNDISASSPSSGLLHTMTETPLSSANPTGAAARTTTYTYDQYGYPDVITYPIGSENYKYKFPALLGYSLTMPEGLTTFVRNRATGDPELEISPQGVVARYAYDPYGRLQSQVVGGAEASRTTYGYLADMVHTITVNGTGRGDQGNETTITPTLVGIDTYLPNTVSDTTGASTTYTYYTDGQVATMTQAGVGGSTVYTYNAKRWLETATSPGGRMTSYTYYPDGKVDTITAPGDRITDYDYDAFGRIQQVRADTAGVDATTSYTYEDNTNRIATVNDPRGQDWTIQYDGYGRTWKERGPLNTTATTTTYDALGYPATKTIGDLVVGYDYDPHGRLLEECRDPGGLDLCTTYSYLSAREQPRWNVMQVTDPNREATSYTYDSRGQLASTADALGQSWTFTYNNLGQLVYQSTPIGGVTTYTTDGHGQRLGETEGDRSQSWTYGPDGRLAFMFDFSGQQITYGYAGDDGKDGLVTSIDYSGTEADVSYTYDDAGNLHTVDDSSGDTTYVYDGLNRLRDQTRQMSSGASYHVGYTYDDAGNLTNLSYPSGVGSVIYTYDDAGRMQTMKPWDAGTTTYHYRSSGLLDYQIRGNGARTDYSYDGAGRLTDLTHASGNTAETISYPDIDKNGNITTRVDSDGTTTYAYDVLNRLTHVSYPQLSSGALAASFDYGYDAAGNRIQVNGRDEANYDGANRLLRDQQDANGNLQNYTDQHPVKLATGPADVLQLSYGYDAANRLRTLSATRNASTSSEAYANSAYIYDGLGQQIRRSSQDFAGYGVYKPTVNTDMVLDEHGGLSRVLAEVETGRLDGVVTTRLYASGPDGIAAQRTITSQGGSVESDTTEYPLLDGQGTPRLITDATGAALLRLSTDAFGTQRGETTFGTGTPPYGFGLGGEQRDPLNGSIYLRARSYQPQAGRFTQRDTYGGNPARPQSLNRYAYTENNPVNATSPSGHDAATSCSNVGQGGDFLMGFGSQLAYVNSYGIDRSLAPGNCEPVATTVGRHLGNVAGLLQGIAEGIGGGGIAGGGSIVSCLTVIGCPTVAPLAVAGGAALALHGASVAGKAVEQELLLASHVRMSTVDEDSSSELRGQVPPSDGEIKVFEKEGYYHAYDVKYRHNLFAYGEVMQDGYLHINMQTKAENGMRNPGLIGSEQITKILDKLGPKAVNGVKTTLERDSLAQFEKFMRENPGVDPKDGIRATWGWPFISEHGFTDVRILEYNSDLDPLYSVLSVEFRRRTP